MKRNITLESVVNRFNNHKNDLIETLGTLVKRQGGFIKVNNCEIETREKMKIESLKLDNDILLITYVDLYDKDYIFSTDDFTYDELYEMLRNVCEQLNL